MSGPTKFTAEMREEYVRLIREGGQRVATARDLRLHPTTVSKAMWRRNKETGLSEPTAFGKQVLEAEREADEPVVKALYSAATSEPSSHQVKAATFWLTNRRREDWKVERNISAEVHGTVSGEVRVTHELGEEARRKIFGRVEQMASNLGRARELPGAFQVPIDATAHEDEEAEEG